MVDSDSQKKISLEEIVKIVGWITALAAGVVSIVLWIQAQGNDRFYPKLAGEMLEQQLLKIEQHMDAIESQNIEVIRILGRIEGSRLKPEDK